jgi:hypothetical protein
VIINRFGKRERNGQGLSYIIERALEAHTPVVIAVSSDRFADWITFAGEATVRLGCDRASLDSWWRTVSARIPSAINQDRQILRRQ